MVCPFSQNVRIKFTFEKCCFLFLFIISLSRCITSSKVCWAFSCYNTNVLWMWLLPLFVTRSAKPLFWRGTYPFFGDVFVQIVSAIISFGAHFQERKRLDLCNTEFRNKNYFRKHCVLCFYFEFVCSFCLNKLLAMHVVNWLSEYDSNALFVIRSSWNFKK